MRTLLLAVFFISAALLTPDAAADEKLKGIACRSVHLAYTAPKGTAFYNEMTVEKSAEGTYFMAAGFSKGYFGIQEKADGKKVVIFSVWDPTSGDDPKKVDPEKRVKMLHQGENVEVKRFGGEGTGGQSFYTYDWKIGEPYRFYVTAAPDGKDRTAFSSYFYLPEKKEWKHLVTFSTLVSTHTLSGHYSFVEDFRRNRISTTKPRIATFGNGWVRSTDGKWEPLLKARFTADANPVENIDAGITNGKFFLKTGGDTKNITTKLKAAAMSVQATQTQPPADLPK